MTNAGLTTVLEAYETVDNNITLLALKADKLTTYTKTDIDTSLALKSNITYVDTGLALKSNITYVDTNLALKQNALSYNSSIGVSIIDVANNNIRKIFAVAPLDISLYFDPLVTDNRNNQLQLSINLDDYSTTSQVETLIANLVNSAPSFLIPCKNLLVLLIMMLRFLKP